MNLRVQPLRTKPGQALTEMAIITPFIIVLLISVFEAGAALRAYLILTNANREAARFAVRQNYLDFDSPNINYQSVWTHTLDSISGQIDYGEGNGVMIISYVSVIAGCSPPYTVTTPIQVPTYTWTYPATATKTTRLDYAQLGQDMLTWQIKHSCDLEANGLVPAPYSTVVVEQYLDYKQVLGFPGLHLLDPIQMYCMSNFRKIPEVRQ